MADVISCPACQRKLQVPESYYGQAVQCPECRHTFTAQPTGASVQTAPPPASAPAPSEPVPASRSRRPFADEDDDFDEPERFHRPQAPHRGGLILALGILALVVLPCTTIVCGPMAWTMGNADLAQMRAGTMDPSGEGMTQAGRILGIVSTALMVLVGVFYCFIIALAVAQG